MIISLGEIDTEKLPTIHWKEGEINDSKVISIHLSDPSQLKQNLLSIKSMKTSNTKLPNNQETIRLIVQHKKRKGWDYVNIIAYDKHFEENGKQRIFPNKVALIGDTIYLCNVGDSLNQLQKITIHKRSSPIPINDLEWRFELHQDCPEFTYGDLSAPITIDRLKMSWVDKLRPSPQESTKQRKGYTNTAKDLLSSSIASAFNSDNQSGIYED